MTIEYQNAPRLYIPEPTGYLPGETVAITTSTVSVRKPNGKWLSVQPNGSYEERDAVGPWETFTLDASTNVLRVTVNSIPYVVAYRGV